MEYAILLWLIVIWEYIKRLTNILIWPFCFIHNICLSGIFLFLIYMGFATSKIPGCATIFGFFLDLLMKYSRWIDGNDHS